MTAGCTKQACGFSEKYSQFQEKGAIILGVSKDSVASHKRFEEKYGLPFTLLADPEKKVIQLFDVWKEKKNYGKVSMGFVRTTYLIDEDGTIIKAIDKVKAADYPEEKLREKYNLTQSSLARSLGVSSNAISGIEAGRIKLSPKMSARIKEVYGEELTSAATEKPAEAAVAAPEKKTTTKKTRSEKKSAPEKATESVAIEAATTDVPAKEKMATKKGTPKKTAEAAAPKAEKKPEKKAPAAPTVILQSPFGGEITVDMITSRVGEVDKVYVRIDQNKLYWVKGKETGNKDIW